ncbi:MAG: 2-aminophenol/2-amino-5-chlorophenol 1,6-dioxygenase subunit alpha [Thermoanaerobaculia bacterium]|nr:2-aminophenol/2-amino-5-chlorophenol 1,6-dioxygenase subunit alpha [Thermoanaerobaculia bacterium]
MSSLIQKAYLVPGQPHILLGADRNAGWASLKASYEAVGREIERSGAELILLYSTQWFSVIGHLFQTDPNPKWTLVDQNWYELGEIPYSFRVDPEFGALYAGICKELGMQTATVAYHGFPIDTGTVVALKLLTPNNAIPASMVSCNIYAERDETRALGRAARTAIERYGKKAIVVIVSNLSNRYEVGDIDPAHDKISSSKDDEWNRKILEMLGEGRLEDVAQVAREFGREANADMGFKAIWWLAALAGENNKYDGKVWDYQPVWGTGNAIVELTPNPNKALDFEKEFDEGPAEQGTGLESHNVIEAGPDVHRESEMTSDPGIVPSASDTTQVTSDTVVTSRAAAPVGAYPHARRVGDLLFLSGIGPRRPVTNEIPLGIEAQTRATVDNVRVILEEAGSSLEKILDVTVYLTDMKRDFDAFNRVYAALLGHIQPTRTTVGVDSLPTPIAVEMKIIAAAR